MTFILNLIINYPDNDYNMNFEDDNKGHCSIKILFRIIGMCTW